MSPYNCASKVVECTEMDEVVNISDSRAICKSDALATSDNHRDKDMSDIVAKKSMHAPS